MNRSIITTCALAVALILPACSSFDVNRSYNITYDMTSNDFSVSPPGGMSINEGDLVSFELRNVNPFVYDVTINQKSIVSGAEFPPIVRANFRGGDLPDTVRQVAVMDVANNGRVNVAAISHFGGMYTTFRNNFNALYSFITFDEYLASALKQSFVDEAKLKESIGARLGSLTGGTQLGSKSEFINKAEELRDNLTKSYYDLSSEYQYLDSSSKGELRDLMLGARRAYNAISNRDNWMTKVSNAADIYMSVRNTPFSFSSFKVQADGDVVRFVIDGRRREVSGIEGMGYVRPFNLEYTMKVNRGWKIDASAGFFVSTLVNESYTTRESNGGQYILKRKGDILNYGPGALMHFYYQPIGVGANLGLFTNNFSNIQFLLGPSLLLGDDHRFCVNGGVTLGKVTRLGDGYADGDLLALQGIPNVAVPTVDRLDLGWYLGFSYNFTSALR
jgi:hypothetical protein